MRPARLWLVAALAAAALFVAPLVAAAETAMRPTRLVTSYQTIPVQLTIGGELRELHRIMVTIERIDLAGGHGILQLDGTACKLVDPFGETTECMPGIYPPTAVRFTRLRLADPAGRSRRVYQIENAGVEEQLFLVVPELHGDSYRLTVKGPGQSINRVLTLEHELSIVARCEVFEPCVPRRHVRWHWHCLR